MKDIGMKTLSGLLHDIQLQDAALPLIFETKDGEVSPGYHVTELAHFSAKGIDCGGNTDTWQEARLQLLDGQGSDHMTVGKFKSIVSRSLSVMPELGQAPLKVEFGHDNTDLQVTTLSSTEHRGDRVVIGLGKMRAVCKPAERASKKVGGSSQCCGGANSSAEPSSSCSISKSQESISSCCA
ncbi:MAG: DUF6428 family protein [Pseudomonadota bacterium]